MLEGQYSLLKYLAIALTVLSFITLGSLIVFPPFWNILFVLIIGVAQYHSVNDLRAGLISIVVWTNALSIGVCVIDDMDSNWIIALHLCASPAVFFFGAVIMHLRIRQQERKEKW